MGEGAVRATHQPTGLSVRCSEERSQSRNRQLARERLLLKLLRQQEEAAQSAKTDNWSRHDALMSRNFQDRFRISYYEQKKDNKRCRGHQRQQGVR